MPKVVSVHLYRGGTGKSNFNANLATTIAMYGHRVRVVDTDVPSPGIHTLFGLEPEQTTKTLNSYLWGESAIKDAALCRERKCRYYQWHALSRSL